VAVKNESGAEAVLARGANELLLEVMGRNISTAASP
jgi:hypothetical protein